MLTQSLELDLPDADALHAGMATVDAHLYDPEQHDPDLSDPDGHAAELEHDLAVAVDDGRAFAAKLLGALATMAVRSKRRQADLSAALKRSSLRASGPAIMAALRQLEEDGCIEDLVPLYDGGVLMSVTSRGIEHLHSGPRWTMFDGPGFRML